MRIANELLYNAVETASTATSDTMALDHLYCGSVTAAITNSAPSNKTFAAAAVNTTDDTATITSHGYLTGLKVQVSTDGALPTGLAGATDYYLIKVDANTVKFATSQANAIAGTAINLTAQGSGTNTVEVNSTLAGTLKLQRNDFPVGSEVWVDVASGSQNITATSNLFYDLTDKGLGSIGYRSLRAIATVTSGQLSVTARINAKGV